jgi:hypothetical protein
MLVPLCGEKPRWSWSKIAVFWNSEKKRLQAGLQARLAELQALNQSDTAHAAQHPPKMEIRKYKAGEFLCYDSSGDQQLGREKAAYFRGAYTEVLRRQITHIDIFTRGSAPMIGYSEFREKDVARGAVPGRITIHLVGRRDGEMVNCHGSIVDNVLMNLINTWKHG